MVRFGAFNFLVKIREVVRFNSSMVRFGAVGYRKRKAGFAVSIPVWCDLENLGNNAYASNPAVSIPVWCDLEPKASIR